MTPLLITGPALEPVSLAEAKAWLKQDSADDDTLISALITAARLAVEKATRLQLIVQTWRLYANRWPFIDETGTTGWQVALPLAPINAITAITLYDQNDTPQILPASAYRISHSQYGPRLTFPALPQFPARSAEGIVIDLIAGFGTLSTDVPEPLRQAIRLLVASYYANRGDDPAIAMPPAVSALIAPYRRLAVRA